MMLFSHRSVILFSHGSVMLFSHLPVLLRYKVILRQHAHLIDEIGVLSAVLPG